MFGRRHTARTIGSRGRVVVPRRIGDQHAALDPVHVVALRGDKVRLVDDAGHVGQLGAQGQDHGRLQLTGVAHAAAAGQARFGQYRRGDVAVGMQPGRGAEDASVALPGVLDHVDQKGAIAAVTAHQVHLFEPARHQRINHGQPEILEGPAADVERTGE